MPPKFKPGDLVLYDSSPQNHPFCAHKPESGAGCSGSMHDVVNVVPFTLHTGQVVNAKGLGSCTVSGVVGRSVELTPKNSDDEHFIKVTDVDQPDGTPIPSYELKGQLYGSDTFWAEENTLTLVKAHDPNVFNSTTWVRPGAYGERRSTRQSSATKAWAHF